MEEEPRTTIHMKRRIDKLINYFSQNTKNEFGTGEIAERLSEDPRYIYKIFEKLCHKYGVLEKQKYGKRVLVWRVRGDP